jgi:protein TonB
MEADFEKKVTAETPVEAISMPAFPEISTPKIAKWNPGPQAALREYADPRDYLEMVRLKIENHKQYPEAARRRRIEGRATLRFTIASNGKVRDVKVIKRAGSRTLNEAAVLAVSGASPFPEPPAYLFKGPISLEVTLVFELT